MQLFVRVLLANERAAEQPADSEAVVAEHEILGVGGERTGAGDERVLERDLVGSHHEHSHQLLPECTTTL